MKFLIVSHVNHTIKNNAIFGYGPYIREMNLWLNKVDSVEVVANLTNRDLDNIDLAYQHRNIYFTKLKEFNLTSSISILKAIASMPMLLIAIFKAMKRADHIHLRCPGNVGLLGCVVQIFYPNKTKTAKYAGNWDPKAKQPWSYRLQKWILNNTFLTKNMQVLVYGEWEGMSKNIKPFFTATYTNNEAEKALAQDQKILPINKPIQFMFVGTLTANKRPMYALEVFKLLSKTINQAELHFYGEGNQRQEIIDFCISNNISNKVFVHGNQPKEVVEKAYINSHFLFLASKSEGWPKVVAEAMFWGCVPLATNVSCVHQMMGYGERGVLLQLDPEQDVESINTLIQNPELYKKNSTNGKHWSTQYTLDRFEAEIKNLLNA